MWILRDESDYWQIVIEDVTLILHQKLVPNTIEDSFQ
jgi:hypothetical protein